MTKPKLGLVMKELPKVNNMGHRTYVGGNWDYTGKKQFDFMIEEGLKPHHTFLDIGCGCFRGGRFFIDYLDKGNYFGVEKHSWLVVAGKKEIGNLVEEKNPRIEINDSFSFYPGVTMNYALAKSVFTHLMKDRIKQCLTNLWPIIDGPFYASISIGDSKNNPKEDHDNKRFVYSIDEIKELAGDCWSVESLGNRGCHKQVMLKLCKK